MKSVLTFFVCLMLSGISVAKNIRGIDCFYDERPLDGDTAKVTIRSIGNKKYQLSFQHTESAWAGNPPKKTKLEIPSLRCELSEDYIYVFNCYSTGEGLEGKFLINGSIVLGEIENDLFKLKIENTENNEIIETFFPIKSNTFFKHTGLEYKGCEGSKRLDNSKSFRRWLDRVFKNH